MRQCITLGLNWSCFSTSLSSASKCVSTTLCIYTFTNDVDRKLILFNVALPSSPFSYVDLGLVCADLPGTEACTWSKNPAQGHQIAGIALCTTSSSLSDNVLPYLHVFSYCLLEHIFDKRWDCTAWRLWNCKGAEQVSEIHLNRYVGL